jgi:hypothetical protein
MKQIKRTNISIESREILVIRNGAPPPEIHCPNCGAAVELLTPHQAAERGIEPLPEGQDAIEGAIPSN